MKYARTFPSRVSFLPLYLFSWKRQPRRCIHSVPHCPYPWTEVSSVLPRPSREHTRLHLHPAICLYLQALFPFPRFFLFPGQSQPLLPLFILIPNSSPCSRPVRPSLPLNLCHAPSLTKAFHVFSTFLLDSSWPSPRH